jgi:TatD DNase family protein
MIDFHCHLDLYKNPIDLLPQVNEKCKFVLAVTTSPRAWEKTSQYFSAINCVKTALGLHPEVLGQKLNERDLLISYIHNVDYIGEIGIDGLYENIKTFELQKEFFEEVIKQSEKCGGKVLSIHSRKAETAVLSILEKHLVSSTPVLHWFSGSVANLKKALSMGCYFSINPIMLSTVSGRLLISKIPINRILPETDAPFTWNKDTQYMPWDTDIVLSELSKLLNMKLTDVGVHIDNNLVNIIQ